MKTVGQIIRAARQKRNLSVDQLSSLTKIDARYISALEEDLYHRLPSETFTKGFIRNLCQRLDLNSNELVAIFRRDYRSPQSPSVPQRRHRLSLPDTAAQAFPFILGGVVFFVYLIFQFRAIMTPPKLSVSRPESHAVLTSPVEIEGDTAVDVTVYLNEETKVKPDTTGHFLARLNLPLGENVLEIKALNRFSRFTVKKIPVTIISK